jgi:ABC-type transport system substrate-binding protein
MTPEGALNIGQSSLGTLIYHPSIAGNPAIFVLSTVAAEGLVSFNKDREPVGMLVESWSISDDFTTWTYNVRKGVQFHKGYGEMTADDIIYSYQQWGSETSVHARGSFINEFWSHPDGSAEAPDPFTVVVDTVDPWVSTRALEFVRHVGGSSASVVSQKQSEELGIDATSRDPALTGPWALVETKTGEFWKFEAVEDHWRKTPAFAELVLWEIPEESARLAGFQTGNLDTFVMSFDNIPQVEKVPGAQLHSVGLISQAGLNIYGQLYVGIDDPDQKGDWDPDRPWVSANPDVNSPEWDNARKVRRAMSIAIDRQTIVDTLLGGFGAPLCVRDWGGYESQMPANWTCDFDPEGAKALLAEAGYPDGFTIELAAAIRGVPAEVEACEAIASMWEKVGITVKIQRIPYQTLRPQLVGRTWPGATCHAISIRLEPMLGLNNYMNKSTFNYGTFHSYLDENIPGVVGELDNAKRRELTIEMYDWMVNDHQLGVGLYTIEGVLPIGPKIQPWEYTSFSDIRIPNGYENILPR